MENKRYRCLIVDDEPIARKIIINYIAQLPFLVVAAESISALTAIEYLKNGPPLTDIIFLDINMPNLSGIQLLKVMKPVQPVIFTTAYPEYAVESYDLNAVDYLLKPFSFERFTKAVYKAVDAIKGVGIKDSKQTIFIKSDGRNHPVCTDEILYCEAMKNYTMLMLTNNRKLMPLISLSAVETMLGEISDDFIRVHRSFLIAKKYITAVTVNDVILGKFEIPIGINFKEGFLKLLGIN